MIDNLSKATKEETYQCKILQNDTVKITTSTPETYRKLIRHLNSEKIIHHTYQMKQDRAYRVVIRNLHYSIPTEDIRADLQKQGHKVRHIFNIRHRVTKLPLSLFYVDLEPKENNKDVYNLQYINNMKITVEPPNKRSTIIQCTRCQSYGHSKTYCTRPYKCVKCGEDHMTADCRKTRDLPPRCALCSGAHTANYKGCIIYKDLQLARDKRTIRTHPNATRPPTSTSPSPDGGSSHYKRDGTSYSQVLSNTNQVEKADTLSLQLHSFLQEFKNMFTQLINQNSMILNMLTTIITNPQQAGR